MKNSRIILMVILGGAVQLRAEKVPVVGTLISDLVGKAASMFLFNNAPSLAPENEAKIREIAQEMGITENFTVHVGENPSCSGNRLYFTDDFFSSHKDNPEVVRFIVGHELCHLENQHSAKQILTIVAPGALAAYLLAKYIDKTELGEQCNGWLDKKLFFIPKFMRSSLGKIMSNVLLFPIVLNRISAMQQSQEFEADSFSVERPSNHISKKDIVMGAANYLLKHSSIKPYTWQEKHFTTHPHSNERLRALSFTEQSSKEAGEKIVRLYRQKFVLSLCYLNENKKKKGDAIIWRVDENDEAYRKNGEALRINIRLCQVYPHVATEFAIRLGDLKNELTELGQALEDARKLRLLDESCLNKLELHDRDRLRKRIFDSAGRKRADCASPKLISAEMVRQIDQTISTLRIAENKN